MVDKGRVEVNLDQPRYMEHRNYNSSRERYDEREYRSRERYYRDEHREKNEVEQERERGGGLDNAGQPNDQLIFQGLDPSATELDLHRALEEKGAKVENVILIRDKDTRLSRCFAFAKFKSVGYAQEFTEKYFPFVYMGMQRVRFAYSRDMKEVDDGWTCSNVRENEARLTRVRCSELPATTGVFQVRDDESRCGAYAAD
ncbi:putative RNA-binding protein isoform C [Neolecta irregularis DAH-3]|uniref:Putative RNA-binding protein isoform C n=1 Tax=Neolecta irregularis (strain DAH-3) TaxID=1198029 RepID=A0A1U7LL67_NEOID|nr:putative RNA-binding protein isoform C [Neolecta irregularis DAH-3]|eukprot:OLL23400.1 putative RNA-binding protein isoform C [Neolecta irregularis DAH-3]